MHLRHLFLFYFFCTSLLTLTVCNVLKTFMLKKKKATTAFPPFQVCPGYSRSHIALFANSTGFPLTCCAYLATLASANPFIYSFICAPSSVKAKPPSQQLQRGRQRLKINNQFYRFYSMWGAGGGGAHFYMAISFVSLSIKYCLF